MKRLFPLILLVALAGCSTAPKTAQPAKAPAAPRRPVPPPISPQAQLAAALQSLAKGDTASARRILTAITEAAPVAGVTDEALFRLAVLSLRPTGDNAGAHQLLRRLKREYPSSLWTAQAQPLTEALSGHDDLRRQNRNLRSQKEALGRENTELRGNVDQLNRAVDSMKQNIEQMKHLDLELEKKNR